VTPRAARKATLFAAVAALLIAAPPLVGSEAFSAARRPPSASASVVALGSAYTAVQKLDVSPLPLTPITVARVYNNGTVRQTISAQVTEKPSDVSVTLTVWPTSPLQKNKMGYVNATFTATPLAQFQIKIKVTGVESGVYRAEIRNVPINVRMVG
jgi:hypothetical protein